MAMSRLLEDWSSLGVSALEETIWTSSARQSDLARLREFLEINIFTNVDVAIIRPNDDEAFREVWTRHYTETGQCNVTLQSLPIPRDSNHLKLTFGYKNEIERDAKHAKVSCVVNSMRLIFGVTIARERILTRHFSKDNPTSSSVSEVGYSSLFDIQGINCFENPPIQSAILRNMPKEAAMLLDSAFSQKYAQERFVLMWLAFEAIINTLPGKGSNGKKREKFFEETLESEEISKEVHRLFRVRCAAFKEGAFPRYRLEDDCWSLYCAMQLALLGDCPHRHEFKLGYETDIQRGWRNRKQHSAPP